MAIRARNNTVIVRPTYEPLRRLSKFASLGEEIDTKEFGKVKIHGSQDYVNTNPGKEMAWGVVESVGKGAAWMGDKYRLDKEIGRGDIVGFDPFKSVSTAHEGEKLFFLPVDQTLCRFNHTDERPVPLGVHMLTVEEHDAAERFFFKSRAHGIILPKNEDTGVLKVGDSPWSKVKFTVERVLAVGNGGMAHSENRTERSVTEIERETMIVAGKETTRVISSKVIEKVQTPVYIKPDPEAVGLCAIFMFTMSTDLLIHGVRHRFTNWDRVRGLWDG